MGSVTQDRRERVNPSPTNGGRGELRKWVWSINKGVVK